MHLRITSRAVLAHLKVARQDSPAREYFFPRAGKPGKNNIFLIVPRQCRAAVAVTTSLIILLLTNCFKFNDKQDLLFRTAVASNKGFTDKSYQKVWIIPQSYIRSRESVTKWCKDQLKPIMQEPKYLNGSVICYVLLRLTYVMKCWLVIHHINSYVSKK